MSMFQNKINQLSYDDMTKNEKNEMKKSIDILLDRFYFATRQARHLMSIERMCIHFFFSFSFFLFFFFFLFAFIHWSHDDSQVLV